MFPRSLSADDITRLARRSLRHLALFPVVGAAGLLLVLPVSDDASAAPRLTCSRALKACGTPRVCQSRYQACLETGCWTVWRVKRCGYERR